MCFIRKNVYFNFPSGYVLAKTPEVREQISKAAYALDSAVRDKNPAVTIVRMPKQLDKTN